jgi:hypothetical protein
MKGIILLEHLMQREHEHASGAMDALLFTAVNRRQLRVRNLSSALGPTLTHVKGFNARNGVSA